MAGRHETLCIRHQRSKSFEKREKGKRGKGKKGKREKEIRENGKKEKKENLSAKSPSNDCIKQSTFKIIKLVHVRRVPYSFSQCINLW